MNDDRTPILDALNVVESFLDRTDLSPTEYETVQKALKVLQDYVSNEMTFGDRYTDVGQRILDAAFGK